MPHIIYGGGGIRNNYKIYALLVLYFVLLVMGQILGKLGSEHISIANRTIGDALFLYLILSYLLMAVSGFIWLFIIKTLDLSYAYPFMSLSYVTMLFVSYYLFNETITEWKVGGSILITFGVIAVASEQ